MCTLLVRGHTAIYPARARRSLYGAFIARKGGALVAVWLSVVWRVLVLCTCCTVCRLVEFRRAVVWAPEWNITIHRGWREELAGWSLQVNKFNLMWFLFGHNMVTWHSGTVLHEWTDASSLPLSSAWLECHHTNTRMLLQCLDMDIRISGLECCLFMHY